MSAFEILLTLIISLGAVIWGVNIYNQKGTWFLAGWNTMRKEEKETYNEEAMCHLFGRCVVFCGIGTTPALPPLPSFFKSSTAVSAT